MLSHFFFFNDTATTEIYTLSLHDALPIYAVRCPRTHDEPRGAFGRVRQRLRRPVPALRGVRAVPALSQPRYGVDRKSTRLNSSHANISYAVFCLKKKQNITAHRHIEAE